jgi:vitamin B12 transporter
MSYIRYLASLLASSTCCVAAGSPAAETGPDDVIIVTASRTPTPLESVLPSSFVIPRDELSHSLAFDVADLLQFHPGIDVARTGGPGQPVSVFIRGAESNHTLVLVDGIRVNPGTIGSAALQYLPPALIERVEVIKGPRSALYGSDAIGGVVNVVTREAAPGAHLEAQAGRGAYSSTEASVLGSVAGDRGSLTAGMQWIDSEGFPTRTTDDTDRGFENFSGQIHGRMQLGAVEVGLRHWQAAGTSQYSDFFLTPVDQDFRNAVTAADVEFAPAAAWRTHLTLSRMEDRIEQNESDDRLETERYALDWQNDIAIGAAQLLTAGLLLQREDAQSSSFGFTFAETTDIADFYVQDRIDVGRHSIELAAGLTDHDAFGSHTTWNAQYGIEVGGTTRVTLSAGTAFRAPDATDRYGYGGNPELAPERSLSYEVGVRQTLHERHLFGLSVFENDIDDLIEFVLLDFTTFEGELRNVEQARILGVEASYEYRGSDWRVRAEAAWQDPENRTTGEQLLRRARESATLSWVRSFGSVDLIADVLYAGPREDFGFPERIRLSSYVLANLAAQYRIGRDWSVLARVENVLDEQYELASGYNTPDRSVFVALRYAPGP